MRTVLALAALAAVAATTSVEAQTCTNSSLAFITESTGPFVQQCAAVVTAPALAPYSASVALTTLLDPTATVSFLGAAPVADAVNLVLETAIPGLALAYGQSSLNLTLTSLIAASQGSFSRYPASLQNPYGYNFTRLKEVLTTTYPTAGLGAALYDAINGTVFGVSNYVLCPTLKNITQSLIGCVPSNCNNLALQLCQNPTAVNAAQLMGVYADKPFTVGTLAIFANIGASCGGALTYYKKAETLSFRTLLAARYGYAFTESTFDASCSVLANPALAGTFQYPATKSPTTKSAGAVLGAGVLAAVAAVASVVAF